MGIYTGEVLDAPPSGPSFAKETVKAIPRIAGGIATELGEATQFVTGDRAGTGLTRFGKALQQKYAVDPAFQEAHPLITTAGAAAEGVATMVPYLAGEALISAVAPEVGVPAAATTVARGFNAILKGAKKTRAISTAVLPTIMGAAQGQRSYESAVENGMSSDEALSASMLPAATTAAGFAAMGPASRGARRLFGKPAVEAVAKDLTKPGVTGALKEIGAAAVVDAPIMQAQGALTAEAEKLTGARPNADPVKEVLLNPQAWISAALTGGMFGGLHAAQKAGAAKTLRSALETPDANMEFRAKAVQSVFENLKTADPELASSWRAEAMSAVRFRQPIPVGEDLLKLSAPEIAPEAPKPEDAKATIIDAVVKSVESGGEKTPLEILDEGAQSTGVEKAVDKIESTTAPVGVESGEVAPESYRMVNPETGETETVPVHMLDFATKRGYALEEKEGFARGDEPTEVVPGVQAEGRPEEVLPGVLSGVDGQTGDGVSVVRGADEVKPEEVVTDGEVQRRQEALKDGEFRWLQGKEQQEGIQRQGDVIKWGGKDAKGNTVVFATADVLPDGTLEIRDAETPEARLLAVQLLPQETGIPLATRFNRTKGLWDLGEIKQEFKSAKTSINSAKLPATFKKLEALGAVKKGDVIADIGGGRFDNAVVWAKERGATLHVVDPYNRTQEHNAKSIEAVAGGKANVATVNNVLNVIKEPANRERVLKQAYDALKPGGKLYVTVYEGDGSGVAGPTQKGESYQANRKTGDYKAEIEAVFGNVKSQGGLLVAEKLITPDKFNRAKAEGVAKPLVEEQIKHILPKLKIPVEIVEKKEDIKTLKDPGFDFNGVYHEGKIYLVAGKMGTAEEAQRVLLDHEVRHAGVREVLGADFTKFLGRAWSDRGVDIRSFAEEKGIDWKTQAGKLEATEEWIVEFAKTKAESPLWDKFVSLFRDWMRKAGFDLKISDSEIRQLVSRAGEAMFKKSGEVKGETRFSDASEAGAVGSRQVETARKQWLEKGTDSPFFRKWFGESKVVDAEGKPLVVYHGTQADFTEFAPGEAHYDADGFVKANSGADPTTFLGAHFAEETRVANQFANGLYGARGYSQEGSNVMPVYLSIKKPLEVAESKMRQDMLQQNIDTQAVEDALNNYAYEHGKVEEDVYDEYDTSPEFREQINRYALEDEQIQGEDSGEGFPTAELMASQYRSELEAQGYDGVKYQNEIEGGTSYIAFSPEQIKSATGNRGTFDSKNPDIRFNADGKPVLWFSKMQRHLDEKTRSLKGDKPVPASHFEGLLKDMKKDEVEQSGIKEFLKEHPRVTKNEVMDFLKAGQVELKDVVLGESQATSWETSPGGLTFASGNIAYRYEKLPNGYFRSITPGNMQEVHKTEQEARVYLDDRIRMAGRDVALPTHFAQYTEPGAKEGSYREMFVTAPELKNSSDSFDDWYNMVKRGLREDTTKEEARGIYDRLDPEDRRVSLPGWSDGHTQYNDIRNPVVRIRFNEREVSDTTRGDVRDNPAVIRSTQDRIARANQGVSWDKLGTEEQAALLPIVESELQEFVGKKRILFVEEMQGPSDQNQGKMPSYLRDRIYDLGVKRILAYAKDNGFDGVSWTPGEMQAKRYDLSKQVESIDWTLTPRFDKRVNIVDKTGNNFLSVDVDIETGKITNGRYKGEDLGALIGKDQAAKVMGKNQGRLAGVDLSMGGEGLKRLYDQTLPALFKKYGGEKVGETNIITTSDPNMRPLAELSVDAGRGSPYVQKTPFIPITQATPKSFPLFNRTTEDQVKGVDKIGRASFKSSDLARSLENGWEFIKSQALPIDRIINLAVSSPWAKPLKTHLEDLAQFKTFRNSFPRAQMDDGQNRVSRLLKAAKTDEQLRAVYDTAFKATLYRLDPSKDLALQGGDSWKPLGNARLAPAQTLADAKMDLLASWEKLDGPQREALRSMVDHMRDLRNEEYAARVEQLREIYAMNPEKLAESLDVLKSQFDNAVTGWYVPLIRDGQYFVRAMKLNEAGEPVETIDARAFDRESDARQFVEEMRGEGLHVTFETKADAERRAYAQIPPSFVKDVEAAAQSRGLTGESYNSFVEDLKRFWVDTLSPSSLEGHKLHRKGVQGFEEDFSKAYAQYIVKQSAKVADAKWNWRIADKYRQMWQAVDDQQAPGLMPDPHDLKLQQNLLQGLEKSDQMDEKVAGLTRVAQKLTFTTMLSSPSVWLVQWSQPLMFTVPKLGAKFGFGKASTRFFGAAKEYLQGKYSDDKVDAWNASSGKMGDQAAAMIERYKVLEMEMKNKLESARRTYDQSLSEERGRGATTEYLKSLEIKNARELKAYEDALTREISTERKQIQDGLKTMYESLAPQEKKLMVLRVAALQGGTEFSKSYDFHDLAMSSTNAKDFGQKSEKLFDQLTQKAGFFMRKSETGSRKAAAVASFDLAYKGDFVKAMDYAMIDTIKDTLYDFSQENRPLLMRGNAGRLLFQFQLFRAHTLGKVFQMVKDSIGEEYQRAIADAAGDPAKIEEAKKARSAARKELALSTAVSFSLAGAAGTPLAMLISNPVSSMVMNALAWMFEDPNDPWDLKRDVSVGLHDMVGDGVANLFEKGLPSAFGVDISKRIGLGGMANLIQGEPPAGMTASQRSAWYANRMLGPTWSMVGDWAKAQEAMNNGEYGKMMQYASPKIIKDVFKGVDLATDGVTTSSGKTILKPEDVDMYAVALMLLGVNPLEVSLAREEAKELSNLSVTLKGRRGRLIKDYANAIVDGNDEGAERDAINRWAVSQPKLKITYKELASAVKRVKADREGIKLSKKDEIIKEEYGL